MPSLKKRTIPIFLSILPLSQALSGGLFTAATDNWLLLGERYALEYEYDFFRIDLSSNASPAPDGGVEGVRASVTLGSIKIDGVGVGFGDGE